MDISDLVSPELASFHGLVDGYSGQYLFAIIELSRPARNRRTRTANRCSRTLDSPLWRGCEDYAVAIGTSSRFLAHRTRRYDQPQGWWRFFCEIMRGNSGGVIALDELADFATFHGLPFGQQLFQLFDSMAGTSWTPVIKTPAPTAPSGPQVAPAQGPTTSSTTAPELAGEGNDATKKKKKSKKSKKTRTN